MKSNTFKCYNINIKINHHDDHIGRVITNTQRFYEYGMLDYIKKHIPQGGTYVDIGANIGNHTVFFAKFCADNVVAVEPIKDNCDIIDKNIKDNNIYNCVVYKKGLSKDGRSFSEKILPNNMGACTLVEGGEEVTTITPEELGLTQITLLKIDCEDMSNEIFNAFVPLIKKHKPHIFMEAEKGDLDWIQNTIDYKVVRQFNATPTFHLQPK